MEIYRKTIRFYQKRNFSEKMSAIFDFVKENPKELFRLSLYLMLPVALIQGIFMNTYMNSYLSFMQDGLTDTNFSDIDNAMSLMEPFLGSGFFIMLTSLIGYALLSSLVYTSIQEYNSRGSIKGISFDEIKPGIIKNTKRALIASLMIGLILFGVLIMMVLLAILTPFTLILTIFAYLAMMIPISLIAPVYIFENSSISTAISKGFTLGFKTWGSLFGILFITGLLAGIIQSFASIPWSLVFMVKGILSVTDTSYNMENSLFMSIVQYISSVIMLFFSYVGSILVLLGTAYHYSSATEAVEGTSIVEELENFEQL